jgi:hypothetical protein
MVRTRTAALTLVSLTCVSAAPAFAAGPISLTKARATAYRAGVEAARQTGGKNPAVLSCKRTTSRRALCKVRLRYESGAKTCVLDVKVAFKSRTSSKLVYQFGQTVCS